mmetsp:Transcript_75509/g.218065  ORF Transcript_75509/g.218065 Transcript_75509/m.218065 type:complete len:205 (-) Transcript_75509:10-624(-)
MPTYGTEGAQDGEYQTSNKRQVDNMNNDHVRRNVFEAASIDGCKHTRIQQQHGLQVQCECDERPDFPINATACVAVALWPATPSTPALGAQPHVPQRDNGAQRKLHRPRILRQWGIGCLVVGPLLEVQEGRARDEHKRHADAHATCRAHHVGFTKIPKLVLFGVLVEAQVQAPRATVQAKHAAYAHWEGGSVASQLSPDRRKPK